MNQLPKAPLIEVNYKVRWHIRNLSEMESIQYFLGDYYNSIKSKFPNRRKIEETNLPIQASFDRFSHQFEMNGIKYPNIKIGANLFSLTSSDEYYYWESFYELINYSTLNLINTLKDIINPDHYHLHLEYIDFYDFDFEKNDVFNFLEKNLKVKIEQQFFNKEKNVQNFEASFDYKTEFGDFTCVFQRGVYEGRHGIIVLIEMESDIIPPSIDEILSWSNTAHDICKSSFLKMTEGNLYKSFLS